MVLTLQLNDQNVEHSILQVSCFMKSANSVSPFPLIYHFSVKLVNNYPGHQESV